MASRTNLVKEHEIKFYPDRVDPSKIPSSVHTSNMKEVRRSNDNHRDATLKYSNNFIVPQNRYENTNIPDELGKLTF